ncbi:pre-mRNA-splicing factor SLU7-like [Eurytemora carolleeae]|uniref:pre-mRNA-splicing factor SLU7-like n=1 Tax=Eurytemora carolleeae TaxID=1294199 RepID=UPI000C785E76|nr:pre-mRNA-splicing factor SLU7-like [Eurytemora carolleeae]|eukprot:XP_023337421.1 pre-mRNA-splicing factor SLU7-like [Eurytemora affinis]
MASVSKVAVSRIIQASSDEGPAKKSRDEYRKAKELEEARKLGTEPAAVDEEGRDINPHIPQYISDAPWYLDPKGPTLNHQRTQEEKVKVYSGITEWYHRGVDTSKTATRYRKGACENCGAVTHKKKDCLERPRKVGARFTGANFAPDEFQQPTLDQTFDAKRDRWNGFNNLDYQDVMVEYKKLEDAKKELKKEKLSKPKPNPEEDDGDKSSEEEDDEDKYVDDMDMVGTKVDASERYTVRNLRIREDVAKYLRNLDPNSAHYDPKTRSMRKNPYEGTGKAMDEVDYAGDNFVRISGDTVNHAKSTMFAWEAARKGLDVHMLAEPTKLEALKSEFETKKDQFKSEMNQGILEKYGGEEYLEAPPRELLFSQTEDYVEYSRHGKVLKGEEQTIVRSQYEEDNFPNNHKSVFGSWWSNGEWGFKCCHSTILNSYCTGAAGRSVDSATLTLPPKAEKEESSDSEAELELHSKTEKNSKKKKKKKKRSKKKKNKKKDSSSDGSSSSDSDEDEEKEKKKKLKDAMKKLEAEQAEAERMLKTDERKRPYNSMGEAKAPTEEDLEAYYLKRQRSDDPMANFL